MTAPRRILVQLAHPLLEHSRTIRQLAAVAGATEGVTVNDLYELYPGFDIDVRAEQAALLAHDVVVFLHPFFWYSVPALLKQWQDLVLEHGWAYGAGGLALRRKLTFNVIATGGPAAAYQRTGYNRFTMRELLLPWEQTAYLCGMRYLAPFVVHGALRRVDEVRMEQHVEDFQRLLGALRDRTLDVKGARAAKNLADELPGLLRPASGHHPHATDDDHDDGPGHGDPGQEPVS